MFISSHRHSKKESLNSMQKQCTVQFLITSISLQEHTKGEVRVAIERGEKSSCSHIHKTSPLITLNQTLLLKTTLRLTPPQHYQSKTIHLRLYFRDSQRNLTKGKQELNIVDYIDRGEGTFQKQFDIPSGKAVVSFRVNVIFDEDRKGAEGSLGEEGIITNGTILSETRNNSFENMERETVKGLKDTIVEKERQVVTLTKELECYRRYTGKEGDENSNYIQKSCGNPLCVTRTERHPSHQEAQMQKLRATQMNQQQLISGLRAQLESALGFQEVSKQLESSVSQMQLRHLGVCKQLRESKRALEMKSECLDAKEMELLSCQAQLIKAKMVAMNLWAAIQERGGPQLFDLISADVMQ